MPISAPHSFSEPISVGRLLEMVSEPVISVTGDTDLTIDSVSALDGSAKGSLVFCKASGDKAITLVAASQATVMIVDAELTLEDVPGRCFLHTADPARWFIRALRELFPEDKKPGIHPDAHIEDGATIGDNVSIAAGAFIGSRVVIGPDCRIGPNCSIGAAGLAIAREEDGTPLHYPHLGSVIIGKGVQIASNCVIVRGILENTRIGDYCQTGNLVNIGHNCVIGNNCWISARALLCGSVELGDGVMVGAGACINNHVAIGTGAHIGLGSVVTKNIRPDDRVFGMPARPLLAMRPIS